MKPQLKTILIFISSAAVLFFSFAAHSQAIIPFSHWGPKNPYLKFTTSAQTLASSTCSGITTVQTTSASGLAVTVGSNLTVNLTGSAGIIFYSDSGCTAAVTSVVVATGTSNKSFYFMTPTSGTSTLTASATGYADANQNETITVNGYVWTGGGGDANWSTAANWSGGSAPGAGNVAVFNSTCSQCNATITSNPNILGVRIWSSYAGVITQNAGVIISAGTSGWVQDTGTFAGSNSAIIINGVMALSGGTFGSTSATLTVASTYTVSGSAAFTHNSGTINFSCSSCSKTLTPGTVVYNNVSFTGVGEDNTISGTFTVNGTLTLADGGSSSGAMTSGTILANGNVVASSYGKTGTTLIIINGTGNQSVTGVSDANIPEFQVASTGGIVTYSGNLHFYENYTYTSGTVDASASTVQFAKWSNTRTVTPGTIAYNNVTFGGTGTTYTLSGTMTVNGTLSLEDTSSGGGASLNGGTILAYGNVVASLVGKSGTTLIKISGSSNQTISGVSTAAIPDLEIVSTGGIVTISGTFKLNGRYVYTSGTVDASTSTLNFVNWARTVALTPGTTVFNNVSFAGHSSTFTMTGTLTTNGTLTFADDCCTAAAVNGGTFAANGDVTFSAYGSVGTAALTFGGTTANILTVGASAARLKGLITVNKTGSGSVTLASNAAFTGAAQSFTVTAGLIDLAGFTLNVTNVLTVNAASTLRCSGGTYTNGSLVNNGTIDCAGYAYNWTGAGGNTNWNTAANWAGGVVPTATKIAVFKDTYCGANCNATVNVDPGVQGVTLVSPYTGTITQSAGVAMTIGSTGWSQAAGTFTGGDSAITYSGPFSLTGGTYAASSGTTTFSKAFTISGAPTFTAGTSSFLIAGAYSSSNAISANGVTFNNLEFRGNSTINDLGGGTITVNGLLTLSDPDFSSQQRLNNGTINLLGGLTTASYGKQGTVVLQIVGTSGTQTVTGISTGSIPNLVIATTNTVALSGIIRLTGNFTYTSATSINAGTSTVLFNDPAYGTVHTISPNGISLNHVEIKQDSATDSLSGGIMNVLGDLTLSDNTTGYLNNGTINVSGNMTTASYGKKGTALIKLVGTSGTQTVTGVSTGMIPYFEIATSNTVAFSGTLKFIKDFTYTSATVFNAGTSTVLIDDPGYNGSHTISANGVSFYNLWFRGSAPYDSLNGGTLNVLNDLTLDDITGGSTLSNGTINVSGSVNALNYGRRGTVVISMIGGTAANLSQTNSTAVIPSGFGINKTAATVVTLTSAVNLNSTGQTLNVTSGDIAMNGFAFTIKSGLTLNSNTVTKGGAVLTVNSVVAGTGSLYGGTVNP